MSRSNRYQGFTIVELMIATVVFSLVMLICLTGMVQISRAYYKGITHSRTQEAARNLMGEITEAIQLSGSAISSANPINPGPGIALTDSENGLGAFCAGNRKYTYILDRKVVGGDPEPGQKEIRNALVSEEKPCADDLQPTMDDLSNAIDSAAGERALLGENMRLTRFSVTPVSAAEAGTLKEGSQIWRVDISIAYGDQDLFSVDESGDYVDDQGSNRVICAPSTGAEFCSVVELSTIVSRRIGG